MFQAVINSIQSFGSFSKNELDFFESKLASRSVRRKEFIVKQGETCRAFYFMLKGSAIHTYPADDGTDVTLNLYLQNDWFTDYQSFTSQKPSVSSIQAFENAELAVLDIHALHALIQQTPVFFKAGKLMEAMQYTDISTLNQTPEEKYRNLLKSRPEIIRKFPLKSIASYLRIAPETLSRIRKRIS